MSGDSAGGDATSGAGLQSLLDKFKNSPQAASFTTDGSKASQFTMPGGGIPQYQGNPGAPAGLSGVAAGMNDAQDYSQMVQDQSGMTAANYAQMAQGLAGAGAGAGQGGGQQAMPGGGSIGRGGGGAGAQANYSPAQMMGAVPAATQGTINLQGAATGQGMNQASIQNLLQLLQKGNAGFNV